MASANKLHQPSAFRPLPGVKAEVFSVQQGVREGPVFSVARTVSDIQQVTSKHLLTNQCIKRSKLLWEEIYKLSNKEFYNYDLPEVITFSDDNDSIFFQKDFKLLY